MWIMKDYLELRKEELKKRGNKGFTLMEMLIVVAIIAILIAIAIPVFTSQLENSREAADAGNIRAKYAEVMSEIILKPGAKLDSTKDWSVDITQSQADWQNTEVKKGLENLANSSDGLTITYSPNLEGVVPNGTATFEYTPGSSSADGELTITFA